MTTGITNGRLARLAITTGFLLSACSSGGGGGGGVSTGVFLDSAVQGLGYRSGGFSGVTDPDGRFDRQRGGMVEFFVGDIMLGEGPSSSVMTPVDLVPGATDEQNVTVNNLARFLMTLDFDQDPADGIQIDDLVSQAAVGQMLDFELDEIAFGAQAQAVVDVIGVSLPGGPPTLVSAQAARDHLGASLLGSLAGRYRGTFGGTDSGPFDVFIDRDGILWGYAFSQFDGLIGLEGCAESNRGFVAGDATTGTTFTGMIDADGRLSGEWILVPGDQGTFQGNRSVTPDPALDADQALNLAGTYIGTFVAPDETGPLILTLDDRGNVTAPPPDEELAGTLLTTTTTGGTFEGVTSEACEFSGTVNEAGLLVGTFRNVLENESGTFSAIRDGAPGFDLSGTYTGSTTFFIDSGSCDTPSSITLFAMLAIPAHAGMSFTGEVSNSTLFQGSEFVEVMDLAGTIEIDGSISGTFTESLSVDGVFDSSGNGTFSGQVAGNEMSFTFAGMDTVGGTCEYTGNTLVSR